MSMLTWEKRQELAEQFSPRLVLFPELQKLHRPGINSKVTGDYHPRTVQVLIARGLISNGLFGQREPASLDRLAKSNTPNDELILLDQFLPDPKRAWKTYFEIIGDETTRDERFPLTTYARVQTRGEAIAATSRAPEIDRTDLPKRDEVGRPFFNPEGASENDIAIQYWFCYYFDDWANQHEGDWEGICVFLRATGTEYAAVGASYYAHETGKRRHWAEIEHADETHPLAYIAAGSHASYFQYLDVGFLTTIPGFIVPFIGLRLNVNYAITHIDRVPNPRDFPPLTPSVQLLPNPIEPTNPKDPALECKKWLAFPGNWGIRILGKLGHAGPTGPSQKGLKWHNPFAWMERKCTPDFLVY